LLHAFQITRLICDCGADCIDVGLLPDQFQSQPVILAADMIPQQDGRRVVLRNQNIDCAIVVEITQRHSASSQRPREDWRALQADILKALPVVSKQQHRFKKLHTRHALVHLVIRMSVTEQEIQISIIVIVEEL
jgi:hypothetical protein